MRWKRVLEVIRQDGVNGVVGRIWGKINKLELVEFGIRSWILSRRIIHLHGPQHIQYGIDELLVICVMRNGASHINSYLTHYRRLGVKHFVFIDNDSTDGSIDLLIDHDDVTLLHASVPFGRYESTMRAYLAKTYARGRWCLWADIDELFLYPYVDQMSLRNFIEYLNHNNYTGVIGQMLDMFSDSPIGASASGTDDDLTQIYGHYDIESIRRTEYKKSPLENKKIKMHHGGIRGAIFGSKNLLTKVSLMFMDGKLKPFIGWHHAREVRLADISCVLLHYPFVGTFLAKVEDAVQSGRYGYYTSDEYKAYWKKLSGSAGVSLMTESARRLRHVNELVDNGFLVVTDQYRDWVRSHRSTEAACSSLAHVASATSLPTA